MRIATIAQPAPRPSQAAPMAARPQNLPPALQTPDQLSLGQRLKSGLKSLGSVINQPLFNHFRGFLTSPDHQGAILAARKAMQQGQPLAEAEAQALRAVAEPRRQPACAAAVAYEALMAVAVETGFRDPVFFQGQQDKVLHYLTSAAFTARTSASLPFDASHNRQVAGGTVHALGWLKEALSLPFSPEDMEANALGIRAAHEAMRKMRWQQQLLGPWRS